jgi:hypothetical protein
MGRTRRPLTSRHPSVHTGIPPELLNSPPSSLHATFGFVKRTGVDWMSWLADQARQDVAFRHDLDRWNGPDERLQRRVTELAAQYPEAAYLTAREQERPLRRRVVTSGVFSLITDVVCLTDFPPHITADGSVVRVIAVGKGLTFAGRAEPALRMLLSGYPATIEQVTEVTGVNAAVLAKTLLDEGMCAELTNELAAGYARWCSGAA